ncbi:helix-turn-helix domain-containing protein [Kozakia baliensis]|nr:helix-turn-helix domain-containing protein [Kozakia baliensis]
MPFILKWGDGSEIAAACGVSSPAVSQWKRVPERHLPKVAELLNTTPERLRPDLAVRNLMNKDMDPRDAAKAEEFIAKAVHAVEDKHVAVLEAQAARQRRVAEKAEAELRLAQADAELKRARSALSRTKQNMIHAGVPRHRLDLDAAMEGNPPLPALSAPEVGGVKS